MSKKSLLIGLVVVVVLVGFVAISSHNNQPQVNEAAMQNEAQNTETQTFSSPVQAGAMFNIGHTVQVANAASCANILEGPSASSTVIGCFPNGTRLQIQQVSSAYQLPVSSGGSEWWSVQAINVPDNTGTTQSVQGWIDEQFLQKAD